jgi:CheY-like chemotaxis protein
VDDDADNSSIFRIALKDSGFDVHVFDDPTLALSNFKPVYYDLLILDIKMPKMNGYELYEKIKKIDDNVKVCFLTASAEQYKEEYGHKFMSFSSSSSLLPTDISFLIKPITIGDLIKKVNETITQK